jgi:hypothetical protein
MYKLSIMNTSIYEPILFSRVASSFLIGLLLFFTACQDNHDSSTDAFEQVEFKTLALQAGQGNGASFSAGTDINLALQITNKTGKELDWQSDYSCQLLQQEGFFRLYRKNDDNETSDAYSFIGSPYLQPINCPAINLPATKIPVGASILINIPWRNNPDNNALLPGLYYLQSNFEFKSTPWQLRFDFEIK